MSLQTPKRVDLGAWLADLRRVGGQARALCERGEAVMSLLDLADLKMLEEAARRLVAALSARAPYGLPLPRSFEGASAAGPAAPGGGFDSGMTLAPPDPAPLVPAGLVPGYGLSGNGAAGRRAPARTHGIIGTTEAMLQVHALIEKAGACTLPVLIQGESGTGKELVARAIHDRSVRQERRFFSENCSAITESLLESELFGHVRGSFTGADRDRKGILELADGGTLFLDEIGDMSVRMQSKLLRALQEREFRPVGGKQTIRVDVRIISATNRSLRALIKEGSFREDLFYRVNVITISLPPLRDRRDDIPALVDCFLDRIATDTGLPRKEFAPGALELVQGYEWPGNIRELENVVQRAVALSDGNAIDAADLPDRVRHMMITEDSHDYSSAGKAGEQLMIEKALHNFEGDKTSAARFIGWSRPKLYRRMRIHGIPIDFGRPAGRRSSAAPAATGRPRG